MYLSPDVSSQEKGRSNDQGSQAIGSIRPASAPGKVCKALVFEENTHVSYYSRPAYSVHIITDSEMWPHH
jgi:hypothetical protein